MPSRGGNANNGGNAGPEYLNVNNGVSTSNANYGSPLNFTVRFGLSALRTLKMNGTAPHGEKTRLKEVLVNVQYGTAEGRDEEKADKDRNDTEQTPQ